ncbi:MAG: YdeI/OmpD-associated family protein [Cyanobacteria bacterium P01_D01_bin.105]
MKNNKDDYAQIEVISRRVLRDWLNEHHEQAESIWLVTYKKHVSNKYVSYDDIVEEALCFGWIDSVPRKLDNNRTQVLLSPRKPKSVWSKLNKTRVQKLLSRGLMRPSGQAKIDIAKANGMWTFLDDVEALIIPDDLAQQLSKTPMAKANFEAFSASAKKGILQWIKMAKKADTRKQRIEKTAALAAENIRAR